MNVGEREEYIGSLFEAFNENPGIS